MLTSPYVSTPAWTCHHLNQSTSWISITSNSLTSSALIHSTRGRQSKKLFKNHVMYVHQLISAVLFVFLCWGNSGWNPALEGTVILLEISLFGTGSWWRLQGDVCWVNEALVLEAWWDFLNRSIQDIAFYSIASAAITISRANTMSRGFYVIFSMPNVDLFVVDTIAVSNALLW